MMNWSYLLHPGTYLRMRHRRRQTLRLLIASGCVRSSWHTIRYAMNHKELDTLLYTKEHDETDTQS